MKSISRYLLLRFSTGLAGMQVDPISKNEYQQLVGRATRVYRDHHGEKVLVLADDIWVKVFRRKKLISSKTLSPTAMQFCRNAKRLQSLDIATVKVSSIQHCHVENKYLVWYKPLAGVTLEDVFIDEDLLFKCMDGFIFFLSHLHKRGVYFRSIHFGNVIYDEETDRFGLIDVADMRFRSRRLNPWLRARNFKHFSRRKKDCEFLNLYGWQQVVDRYMQVARMNWLEKKIFLFFLSYVGRNNC